MSKKINEKKVSRIIHIIMFFVSLFFISLSLFIPVTVKDKNDLKEIRLGYPVHFITQDQSHYDPPLPYQMRLASIWENPTQVNYLALIFSFLLSFIVFDGILLIIYTIIIK